MKQLRVLRGASSRYQARLQRCIVAISMLVASLVLRNQTVLSDDRNRLFLCMDFWGVQRCVSLIRRCVRCERSVKGRWLRCERSVSALWMCCECPVTGRWVRCERSVMRRWVCCERFLSAHFGDTTLGSRCCWIDENWYNRNRSVQKIRATESAIFVHGFSRCSEMRFCDTELRCCMHAIKDKLIRS